MPHAYAFLCAVNGRVISTLFALFAPRVCYFVPSSSCHTYITLVIASCNTNEPVGEGVRVWGMNPWSRSTKEAVFWPPYFKSKVILDFKRNHPACKFGL